MSTDNGDKKDPTFPESERFEKIADDPECYEAIEDAVRAIVSIEETVDEEDLDKSTIYIRTSVLYGILDTLLLYAQCVDEVDVDKLIEQHQVDNEMFGNHKHLSYVLH